MPQLVGQNCVLCTARISSELDGHFCTACQRPVHNACVQGALVHRTTGCCRSCGAPVPEAQGTADTPNAQNAAPMVVKPVGFLQLICLFAILAAAAFRLPTHSFSSGTHVMLVTIISSEGGELVFAGVVAGVMLTACQIVALGSVAPHSGRHIVALLVSSVGVCIGLSLFWLGHHMGWFPPISEDNPSPTIGALIVMLAGAGFAYLSGLRLWRLLRIKQAAAPDPPANRFP